MFLSALENTRRGVVACVFDTSDRIQHMFYRQFQTGNGEHAGVDRGPVSADGHTGRESCGLRGNRHGSLRPFRSWILLISPRGQSQFVASSERLPGAEKRFGRQHFSSRRRLVADQSLRTGSRRHVPESARTRSAGHGRAGGRSRSSQERTDRQPHALCATGIRFRLETCTPPSRYTKVPTWGRLRT